MASRACRHCAGTRQRGFTYLWLMFAIAVAGALAAAIGQRTSVATQREKEAELLFRGHAIERAVHSYWAAHSELPRSLDELVDDHRGETLRRHLRRVWADPFTGRDDWALVMDDDGMHLRGVHSSADIPAFNIKGLSLSETGTRRLVSERMFVFDPPLLRHDTTAPTPAPSASMPSSSR